MNPQELRRRFLAFFEARGHRVVPSSPVVPMGDPTLLFANAGMNQFKDLLLGTETRDFKRAASVQMCIRAGGKHNDLDEVGKDGRHLTFFEMLGNWSFGDYYKAASIAWGWQFVTEEMGLDPARLYVTVYKDDDEAYALWRDEVGLSEDHLLRLGDIEQGDEENFWSMGPTGPCGPCTELHYDLHPERAGGGFVEGFDGERYVEIWNHVFMAYNRDDQGQLTPLPMQSVDTGMGLDRAAAILAGVDSVFKTALFKGILERTAALAGTPMTQQAVLASEHSTAYQVIADHIRTLTFAVAEGQPFSNEGRGYVLRRILRRAVRFGRQLGFEGPFLHEVAQAVIDDFSDVYPHLRGVAAQTREVIRIEEGRFFTTLDRGIARFDEVADQVKAAGADEIPGADAFVLYSTYGFPLDLTQIMAEERGLGVDLAGYQAALEAEQARSAEASTFYDDEPGGWVTVNDGASETFVGYSHTETASAIVRYRSRGERYELQLDITPFYAESGGQVGDTGEIVAEDGTLRLRVLDTQRTPGGIVHLCEVAEGFVTPESMASDMIARVDARRRAMTAANHTATHLLHAALHAHVSPDAVQAGSLVRADKLRFDFTHPQALSGEQLEAIERDVNGRILRGVPVVTHVDVPREQATEMGAMAIFGEKYGERVRVVEIGSRESIELCGGTHVSNTRDILMFRVTQETAVGAGTRRIEAVTHEAAHDLARRDRELLAEVTGLAGADTPAQLPQRLERLRAERAELARQVERLFNALSKGAAGAIVAAGREVGGVRVCSGRVEARDRAQLLKVADLVRDRLSEGVALLGAEIDEKPALVCVVSQAVFKGRGLKAGDLVNACATHVDGRGGGRPTLAQAGGADVAGLDAAIAAIDDAVARALTR